MGQGLFQGNNSIHDENAIAMNNLIDSVENAAGSIGGQQTGITTRSDVLELGLMDMAGIEISTGYPSSMRVEISEKNPDTMFIDVKGMSESDVQAFTQFLNSEAGYAVDTGAWEGFDNSIEVSISGIQNLMPDLDRHLDDMSPHLIRNFQEQSGQIPSFQGVNELRQDPSFSQPGKMSFNQDEQVPVSEVIFEEVRVPVDFSSSGKQGFGDQGAAENRIDIDSSSPGKQEFSGQAIPDNRIDVDFSSPSKQGFGDQGVPENRIEIEATQPGKLGFSDDQATNSVILESGNDNQLAQTQVSEWNRVGPITEFGGWDVAANGPLGSAVDINGEGGEQPTLTEDAYEPTMLADASAVQGKLIEQPNVGADIQSDLIQKSTTNFSLG